MASRMAGQTINDRFLAAKHSIAGQGLAKSVCKATTEEMIGPKKKHLDYLVHCTNEPNVSIPQMANLLIERSQNSNWVVVYKALVTVHHVMCYGNERFTQYLASSNCTFHLSNFFDKSGVQGSIGARAGYDMSPFIRKYSRYLNEKAISYRTVAFDFCKVKRGKEDGLLRTMNAEKLLKTLPCLQNQLDALLEFDCSANDLTNGVINMCFMLLFRDIIRLFACYNDGIINLLEKYFDMNKKQCKDALDIYKKFLIRMDRVAEFLRVAENIGIDKGDIPDLTKAPSSLLDALEQHLNSLESKKASTASTPSQVSGNQKSISSGLSVLSSTSTAFGTAVTNGRLETHTNGIDEQVKQQVLAEEEAAINQFKSKVHSPNSANNPFLNNSSGPNLPTMDLLENDTAAPTPLTKASDDLLQLGNPFVDTFTQPQPASNFPVVNNTWLTNGNAYGKQPVITNNTFVSDSNFESVFGSTESKRNNVHPMSISSFHLNSSVSYLIVQRLEAFHKNVEQLCGEAFSDMHIAKLFCMFTAIQEVPVNTQSSASHSQFAAPDNFGVLQPSNQGNQSKTNNTATTPSNNNNLSNGALITGDLESSLASLAENLTIRAPALKNVQWNSPKNSSKSGNNWTPQPLAATTGAGYKPMNQTMASPPPTLQQPLFPQIQPLMGGRPVVNNTVMYPQIMGMVGATSPPSLNSMGQQHSFIFN